MMNSARLAVYLFCFLTSRMNLKLNRCSYIRLCVLPTWHFDKFLTLQHDKFTSRDAHTPRYEICASWINTKCLSLSSRRDRLSFESSTSAASRSFSLSLVRLERPDWKVLNLLGNGTQKTLMEEHASIGKSSVLSITNHGFNLRLYLAINFRVASIYFKIVFPQNI